MKANLSDIEIFLSSDWDSIRSGSIWVEEVERALSSCHHFCVLLVMKDNVSSLWINYEVGFARGRGLLPKIFLFDGVEPKHVPYPLGMLHLIGTGDTNRRVDELRAMGVLDVEKKLDKFTDLLYRR